MAVARVVDVSELTPFERHSGRWYKRDDLFQPFDDEPLSGGKVRQAMLLLERQEATIRRDYGGFVLTATGVHSPQGLIIARACAELDLRCVLFIGATTVGGALMRHEMLRRAARYASIDGTARVAYEGALASAIERWRADHGGAGYVVKFGINLEDDRSAILGSTARQTENLPAGVERIVIAVGAGVTAAGVIMGTLLRPDVEVVCVQIAGYDRRAAIDRMAGQVGGYQFEAIKGIPYSRLVQRSVDGVQLDPIYEAKAHDWMLRNEPADDSVAFWLVGDSSAVRLQRAAAGDGREQRRRAPRAALVDVRGP